MFINPKIILKAFAGLTTLAPAEVDGKTARERVSGIKYFLATVDLIKQLGLATVTLATGQKENRDRFVHAVGRVVRLDDDGGYSNNFRGELERDPNYKVGNNFLTASLKKNGPYPGRPAPLIDREDESVKLYSDWKENVTQYGEYGSWILPLGIWLLRFDEFEADLGESAEKLAEKVYDVLLDRYEPASDFFAFAKDDIANFFDEFNDEPLLVEEKPDYFTLLDRQMSAPEKREATVGQNIIYYGAPGTGKSYRLKKYEPYIRTVFHADYQNSDFVGTYRPFVQGDKVTYRFAPGPFVLAFIAALKDPDHQQYLIIEEINRANAGAVFGEILQLLDRDENGRSEYEIDPEPALKQYLDEELDGHQEWKGKLFIPSNLSVFATMNSADQGVEPIDSAFKRRWNFKYLPIRFDGVGSSDDRRKPLIPYAGKVYDWCEFANACNDILLKVGIDEDRLLGPYFLSNSDFLDKEQMDRIIVGKVFIYLWDDVLRHGLRETLFRTDSNRSFYELSKNYSEGERVFSKQFEKALNYSPTAEE